MKRTTSWQRLEVAATGEGLVSRGGLVLLAETARVARLERELRIRLAPWTRERAVHDPARVVVQLGYALAAGGDCLADVGVLRDATAIVGPVASDPTVSRVVDDLAAGGQDVLDAIADAHAAARARVHAAGGGPAGDGLVPLDIDATLVAAHSDKEDARPTYKRGFGHHPVMAFLDHGDGGTGEGLAGLLRPGNANANNAADLITTLDAALAQLPADLRSRVLVRSDGGGYSHAFFDAAVERGLEFSVGWQANHEVAAALDMVPEPAWTPAYNSDGCPREGADVAEITGLLDLTSWPVGTRIIARREIPHPGAQLRLTDIDGRRVTCFATNTTGGQLADLELRHRRRARVEDRIRAAKDTGLTNLPLHDMASNKVWLAIVLIAVDLLTWTQTLALTGPMRTAEPKRLRHRLIAIAGRLVRSGRRLHLRLDRHWPWAGQVADAITALRAIPDPD
ncbi:MAG TPA: IS1380 family transposase [Mycobacteriales bacterium]|nr:IS1380 family transposase [Mycobacteriales bacterium]